MVTHAINLIGLFITSVLSSPIPDIAPTPTPDRPTYSDANQPYI